MGFFDFFKNAPKELPPWKKMAYQGDLQKTDAIFQLVKVPRGIRDEAWATQFLAQVDMASFRNAEPPVAKGPDGFPYFILSLPDPNQPFESYVIRFMVVDFLLETGYGVVINPAEQGSDWVFSYGDLVNFFLYGNFYHSSVDESRSGGQPLHVRGEDLELFLPTEKDLPKPTLSVIGDFLRSMGIRQPGIIMVRRVIDGKTTQNIGLNFGETDLQSSSHFTFALERLAWYLPRQYGLYIFPHDELSRTRFLNI
jgi:hypothetical protein